MADPETDPHDDKVRTVPLPTNVGAGADRVIAQQNQGPEVALGGGEWPSPETPPSDSAPGGPAPRTVSGDEKPGRGSPDEDEAGGQDGGEAGSQAGSQDGGEDGGEDGEGGFPPMREVLDADPVAGGSQSVPDDADGVNDGDGDGGNDDGQRWGGSRLP